MERDGRGDGKNTDATVRNRICRVVELISRRRYNFLFILDARRLRNIKFLRVRGPRRRRKFEPGHPHVGGARVNRRSEVFYCAARRTC